MLLRVLVSELLALNLEGFSLFFPGSETGLLEGVEHSGVPIPGGVGHGLVEGAAEFQQLAADGFFEGSAESGGKFRMELGHFGFVPGTELGRSGDLGGFGIFMVDL